MPVFHFHLIEGGHRSTDVEGSDFASFELAYLATYRAVQDMSWEMIQRGKDPRRFSFEITDAADVSLASVPFAEVLDHALDPIARMDATRPCSDDRGDPAAVDSPGLASDARRSAALPPMLRSESGRSLQFDVGEPLAE